MKRNESPCTLPAAARYIDPHSELVDFLKSYGVYMERIEHMVRKINHKDIAPINLEGRDLRWIVTEETVGARQMSIAVMHCFPHAIVKPLHAHKDIEEVIYILEGQGEAWIDGDLVSFEKGDAVFFPANSKHQVRNTSDQPLVTASIFSQPTSPDQYISYPESMF